MNRLSLSAKIVVLGIVLPTILVSVLFVLYYLGARRAGMTPCYTEKPRDVCLATEAVRDMEDKWERGVFTKEQVRTWADARATGKNSFRRAGGVRLGSGPEKAGGGGLRVSHTEEAASQQAQQPGFL